VETINKYKNQHDFTRIFKLCNQKIGWRMKDLLDLCKKHITVFHYDQENVIDEKTEVLYPVSIDEDRVSSQKINNIKFKFEELHIILNDIEYDIIYDIFYNGITHKALGKKYKCSRQQITKKYQQAIKKVKSYLNIN
jgi:DNA-directed RNA polymerase specialized sigma subunit